jgi:hypothetical protein
MAASFIGQSSILFTHASHKGREEVTDPLPHFSPPFDDDGYRQ